MREFLFVHTILAADGDVRGKARISCTMNIKFEL